jgi:hypothetical protein
MSITLYSYFTKIKPNLPVFETTDLIIPAHLLKVSDSPYKANQLPHSLVSGVDQLIQAGVRFGRVRARVLAVKYGYRGL